jgi:hypothetical protein
MNIYLCGRNICMPHHGLNVFYGSTALQQVHGKRMTQRVRRNLLRDAGLRRIALDNFPETLPRQTRAVQIDKQRVSAVPGPRSNRAYGKDNRIQQRSLSHKSEWSASPLVPRQNSFHRAQVDILHVEVNELTDANTGGIKKLQHRFIAAALSFRDIRLGKQQVYLLACQRLRQLFLALFQALRFSPGSPAYPRGK